MKKLSELTDRLQPDLLCGTMEKEISAVVYDSRKITEGCLFIAIRGANFDGHSAIPQAIEKKAAAVLAEGIDTDMLRNCAEAGITVVRTENTRYGLGLVAAAWFGYPAAKLQTIGITGTKGKTTTTYLIKSMLENAGVKCGLIGTIEVDNGKERIPAVNTTPESYLVQEYFAQMVENGCRAVVMEVSSQALMMHRVAGITYDIGVFTNLSPDHIGPNEHKDFDDYLHCKSLLFQRCKKGIFNCDDKHFEDILKGHTCEVETFGFDPKADFNARNMEFIRGIGYLGVNYNVKGLENFHVEIKVPGRFSVYNSLTAIAICHHFGVSQEAMVRALREAKVKGRIEMIHVSDEFALMIDYAHNAMALESLLNSIKDYVPERLVCVFGCGGNRSKLRRYEMGEVSGRLADLTIITSDK